MCTSQAQPVISDSAFVGQKESQFLLSAFAHSGHLSPPSALDRFTGRFWRFLRPNAADFPGMVSQPYPFSKAPQTAANGAHFAETHFSAASLRLSDRTGADFYVCFQLQKEFLLEPQWLLRFSFSDACSVTAEIENSFSVTRSTCAALL